MPKTAKKMSVCSAVFLGIALWSSMAIAAAPLTAFPGAEGFGAQAVGGRGGAVYHVTNLDDSGPGSLRFGIEKAEGPTTIVFDIGGSIRLQSPLWVNKNYLTIAGQTAPGDGIAVIGNMTSVTNAHDIVIRYMRFRCGDKIGDSDSLNICDCQDVIFDHISASWGTDETLSVTRANNVTVQNCIIAETLDLPGKNHSYGSLIRGNVDANHPGGYTFRNNLWISNSRRNPGIGSRQTYGNAQDVQAKLNLDLVNNVIYNWGSRSVHTVRSEDNMAVNLVGNTYIAGRDTRFPKEALAVELELSPKWCGRLFLYEAGNEMDSHCDVVHHPTTLSRSAVVNWSFFGKIVFEEQHHAFPQVTTRDAKNAYLSVLATAGTSLVRDAVDTRLIDCVMNRSGQIIHTEKEVGGFPELQTGALSPDADRDGMPDIWEARLSLNPNDPSDGSAQSGNGYTNLENYLNFLVDGATMDSEKKTAPDTIVQDH